MAEGEQLSKKQLQQESTIKKLRNQVKELQAEQASVNAKLSAEEGKVEAERKEKEKLKLEIQVIGNFLFHVD